MRVFERLRRGHHGGHPHRGAAVARLGGARAVHRLRRQRVGTLNLLEACREHCPDAVFIFTSTNKVYGDTPNRLPLVEQETRWEIDPTHPFVDGIDESMSIDQSTHSLFGASKVAADVLVQEYGRYFGMRTGVFRGGCLTGPAPLRHELHGFLAYLMKCTVTGTPYRVFGYKGKQVRDNIHSADLVSAFHAFFDAPRAGEVYNIGGSRFSHCSMLEAIALCEEIAGRELAWTYEDKNRIGDHIWYVSDIGKFRRHYPAWVAAVRRPRAPAGHPRPERRALAGHGDAMKAAGGVDVQTIYERRFADSLAFRRQMWDVLCREFFQRHVPDDATVVEIGAGYCEFINHIRASRKIAVDLNPDTQRYAGPDVTVIISSTSRIEGLARRRGRRRVREQLPRAPVARGHPRDAARGAAGAQARRPVPHPAAQHPVLQGRLLAVLRPHHAALRAQPHRGARDDRVRRAVRARTVPAVHHAGPAAELDCLLKLYLKLRPAWRIFGQQSFFIATPRG